VSNWLLLPPIAFLVLLAFGIIVSFFTSRLAYKAKTHPKGKFKAYACGEDVPCHRLQPNYSQFFPFAFFFTIMHVLALIVATAPASAVRTSGVDVLYLLAAVVGLFILYRKS
jgi:NADH:ubiquinone oxidoreductase subunit 3 (subunit A)